MNAPSDGSRSVLRLIQIPFSHNCVKVRRALDLKGLAYETLDIALMDRKPVLAASGQRLVPVLVDGEVAVADSTRILLHLEKRFPERPLLPSEPSARAECLLLEDWADASLMALTRRIAYWQLLAAPGTIENRFFPGWKGLRWRLGGVVARRALRRRFGMSDGRNRSDEREALRLARIAVDRLGGRPFLVGDALSIADVTLAAMARPLRLAVPAVRDDPAVTGLLAWSRGVLGEA